MALVLEGTPWSLVAGLDVPGWREVAPSATFEAGVVAGSTGCNRYTAPCTIEGDRLEIGPLASTRMACPPPADAVERAFLAALERVAGLRLTDAGLVLVDADGVDVLAFEVASPVGSWQATGLLRGEALTSPAPGTAITAEFAADGTLAGSAGCNAYTARYTADAGRIEITPSVSTLKACLAPEGVMEQEAAYLALLPVVRRYQCDGRSLSLLRSDGTRLAAFTRPAQPFA